MKAIMISVHPQWAEKILNGIKKDEIRKGTALYKAINKLISEQGVAPMLIYCTKDKKNTLERNTDEPYDFFILKDKKHLVFKLNKNHCGYNGKVVARFNATAEEIECLGWDFSYDYHLYRTKELSPRELMLNSQVGYYALEDYLKGKNGTAIHINDLKIFDEPKEISEFYNRLAPNFEHLVKYYEKRGEKYTRDDYDRYCEKVGYKLTRAPQSFMFIEV